MCIQEWQQKTNKNFDYYANAQYPLIMKQQTVAYIAAEMLDVVNDTDTRGVLVSCLTDMVAINRSGCR